MAHPPPDEGPSSCVAHSPPDWGPSSRVVHILPQETRGEHLCDSPPPTRGPGTQHLCGSPPAPHQRAQVESCPLPLSPSPPGTTSLGQLATTRLGACRTSPQPQGHLSAQALHMAPKAQPLASSPMWPPEVSPSGTRAVPTEEPLSAHPGPGLCCFSTGTPPESSSVDRTAREQRSPCSHKETGRVTRVTGGSPRGHTGAAAQARPPAQVQLVGTGEGTSTLGEDRAHAWTRVHGPRCPLHGPSGETRSPGPTVKGQAGSGVLDLRMFVSTVSRVCIGHDQSAAGRVGTGPAPRGIISDPLAPPATPCPQDTPLQLLPGQGPGSIRHPAGVHFYNHRTRY